MVGKLMALIKNRPKLSDLFSQVRGKNIPTGKTPPPLDKDADLATTASARSILSGPEGTVRGLLAQVFPPYDGKVVENFMTRFKGQGLGIFDRIQKWKKPKVVDKVGIPTKKPVSNSALSVDW